MQEMRHIGVGGSKIVCCRIWRQDLKRKLYKTQEKIKWMLFNRVSLEHLWRVGNDKITT